MHLHPILNPTRVQEARMVSLENLAFLDRREREATRVKEVFMEMHLKAHLVH